MFSWRNNITRPVPREIGGPAKQASLLSLVVNYVRFDFAGGPSGADESYNPKQLLLSGIKMTRIFVRAESDIKIKITFFTFSWQLFRLFGDFYPIFDLKNNY